ncbi:MAG: hypothetical protein AB1584_11210 [Pseudomonadota bacterium]
MTTLRSTVRHLGFALASACAGAHAQQTMETPAPPSATAIRQLQAACAQDTAPGAALDHVQVRALPASSGDLPYHEARSDATGASVRIYHDPGLAAAAASKAACLMGLLDLVAAVVPEAPRGIAWSPMVITTNANYLPPRRDGELRWLNVFASRGWTPDTIGFLIEVLPHEEVHLVQNSSGIKLPRWFAEGHADWASLQVMTLARPDLARAARERRMSDLPKLDAPRLGAWGGLRVKPEAIERQLSAQDRARRAQDPSYNPPGPFRFGPDDLVQDNADELGRYGAALALFDGLERRHGRAAVQAWVSAVFAGKDAAQIPALAQRMLGEDITPQLR